jgi:hypothetical protein
VLVAVLVVVAEVVLEVLEKIKVQLPHIQLVL